MKYSSSIILLPTYFLLTCFSSQVNGVSIPLDTASDLENPMWKVKGFSQYVQDASVLRGPLSEYFPEKFQFAHLDLSTGIWVIVPTATKDCPGPEMDSMESSIESKEWKFPDEWIDSMVDEMKENSEADTIHSKRDADETDETEPDSNEIDDNKRDSNETSPTTRSTTTEPTPPSRKPGPNKWTPTTEKPTCYTSSNATFQLTLREQSAESATIRYCFGGNAMIRVGGSGEEPVEMSANHKKLDKWIEEKVPLGGKSMVLEAFVYGKGDYILIEKITVDIMEPKPSPTRPPRITTTTEPSSSNSTTEPPQPSPTSGQPRTGNASVFLTSFFVLTVLISFIYKQI